MGRKVQLIFIACLVLLLLAGGIVFVLLRSIDLLPAPSDDPPRPKGIAAHTSKLPTVYENDFAKPPGEEWSANPLSVTPSGRPFLGLFCNDAVSLNIHSLPKHDLLKVSLELFIIDTWDGVGRISAAKGPCGPDFVEMDVTGGPNLLRATFACLPDIGGFKNDGKLQTYPAPIPSLPSAVGDGAAAINGLGFTFRFGGTPASIPMDGTYPMTFVIPHTAEKVELNFAGSGLQDPSDETWGITNVKIEALPASDIAPADAETMNRWFTQVQKGTPRTARDAFWSLVAHGDDTVKLLSTQADGFGVNPDDVTKLLAAAKVEKGIGEATQRLIDLGPAAEYAIRSAVSVDSSLGRVARKVLQEIELMPIDDPVYRKNAAIARLLTTIDTDAARKLHAELCAKPAPSHASKPAPFQATKPLYGSIKKLADDRWQITGGDGVMVTNRAGDKIEMSYGNNSIVSVIERRVLDVRLAGSNPQMAKDLGLSDQQLEQLKQVQVVEMKPGPTFDSMKNSWTEYLQTWNDADATPQQKFAAEKQVVEAVYESADWQYWDTRVGMVASIKQILKILTPEQVQQVMTDKAASAVEK